MSSRSKYIRMPGKIGAIWHIAHVTRVSVLRMQSTIAYI